MDIPVRRGRSIPRPREQECPSYNAPKELDLEEQLQKEKKAEKPQTPVKKAPVILDDAKLKDMSILFGMPQEEIDRIAEE